jgi:hypothetical protein
MLDTGVAFKGSTGCIFLLRADDISFKNNSTTVNLAKPFYPFTRGNIITSASDAAVAFTGFFFSSFSVALGKLMQ